MMCTHERETLIHFALWLLGALFQLLKSEAFMPVKSLFSFVQKCVQKVQANTFYIWERFACPFLLILASNMITFYNPFF